MNYIKYTIQLMFLFSILSLAKEANLTNQSSSENLLENSVQSTLRFDPYTNGVSQPVIQMDYETNDTQIKLGTSIISEQTFKIFIGTPETIDTNLKSISELGNDEIILISIPSALFKKGSLEIISESGESVWNHRYSNSELQLGLKIKTLISPTLLEKQEKLTVLANEIPINDVSVLSGKKKGSFRFCLKQESGDSFSKICSPPYKISQQTKKLKLQSETIPIRVYMNSKEVAAKGSIPATINQTINFFATNTNQYSVELKSHPVPLNLVDFYRDSSSNNIILTGHSDAPTNSSCKILNPDDETSWLYRIGWIPTIGDLKIYWTLNLEPDNTVIYLMGEAGGQFTYKLKFDNTPLNSLKIKIDQNTLVGSYNSEVPIYGTAPLNSKVTSKQKNANMLKTANERFVWHYELDQKGVEQTKSLLLNEGQNNWLATYSMYRGFSSEISFRLAGVLTQSLQINTLAELAYNHWFESIFGFENRTFSVQRWGISLKTLKPLKTFKLKDTKETAITLALTTVDLKYRLTPGLWERDETWGLILGYEDVKLNTIQAPLLGAGFFWARSMPQLFDQIMNYLPFMSYSKWVDMDFMYYSVPLKSNLSPGTNFAMNFHGKVLWSKTIFGEAGFGFKSYEYKDLNIKKYASLQAFYGTMGIGINF